MSETIEVSASEWQRLIDENRLLFRQVDNAAKYAVISRRSVFAYMDKLEARLASVLSGEQP